MDVRCDRCHTEYELDDESVTEAGASVQCTTCGHTFLVTRAAPTVTPTPSPLADAAGSSSWMLTTLEGKTHRFRDPTTLQKWIVERRVTRDDRVCPPGGSWRRLADMDDLRPFFDVVDQADRAAAQADRGGRGRPTLSETPTRRTPAHLHAPGAGYASPDEDDDDILTSGQRLGAGSRASAYSDRFDSEGLDPDDELGLDVPPRRTAPKVVAGVIVVGLALTGGAYLGWGSRRAPIASSPTASGPGAIAATPGTPAPAAAPAATRAVPAAAAAAAQPASPAAASSPAAPVAGSAPTAAAGTPAAPAPSGVRPAAAPAPPTGGPATGPSAENPSTVQPGARSTRPGADAPRSAGHPSATAEGASHPRSYEQLVAEGDRALENGNTAKAQKLFDEALKVQPDGVAAVTGAGYLMLDKQRPLAAIGMFKRALANAPAFPQALFGLGEAYRSHGDAAQAIDAYKNYLAVAPAGQDAPAAQRQLRELETQVASSRHVETGTPGDPTAPPPIPAN